MSHRADVILALIPGNNVSREACHAQTNVRRSHLTNSRTALTLRFSCPPKDLKQGFLCGRNAESCDLIFVHHSVGPKHFCFTYNTSSGLLLIVNKGEKRTTVNKSHLQSGGRSRVVEHQMILQFGVYEFTVIIPDRKESLPHFLRNQSFYLGSMLNNTPTAVLSRHTTPSHVMKRICSYLEVTQLGEGSFGEVVLLSTIDTGTIFAAKRFLEFSTLDEMKREAATLSRLSHRNIVHFKEMIEERDSIILVMEYLHAGTLLSKIPLSPLATIEVIEQCLDALNYIHSNSLIHRDIKPDNIVLQSLMPMRVKLIDFGLATVPGRKPEPGGAIAYFAPETVNMEAPTSAVDIWSLGIVILEAALLFPEEVAERCFDMHGPPRFDRFFRTIEHIISSQREPLHRLLYVMLDPDPDKRITARKCLALVGRKRGSLIRLLETFGSF